MRRTSILRTFSCAVQVAASAAIAAGCGASNPPDPAAPGSADIAAVAVFPTSPSATPVAPGSAPPVEESPVPAGSALEPSPPSATPPTAGSPPPGVPGAVSSVAPSAMHGKLDEVESALEGKRDAQARAKLTALMQQADQGTVDERLAAHALSGRIHARAKAAAAAESELKLVRDLWAAPATATSIGVAGEPDDVKVRRWARAINAAGAALFFFADQSRKLNVEPLTFPVYRGPPPRAAKKKLESMSESERQLEMERRGKETEILKRFVDTDVKRWVERKRAAIETAEREYKKVVDLSPAPPPRWVVASAARVGQMWDAFVGDLRRVPSPAWFAGDPTLLQAYRSSLEAASEPWLAQARGAFTTCQGYATKFQIRDEYTSVCDAWLASHPATTP